MGALRGTTVEIPYCQDHDLAQKNVFPSSVAKVLSDLALITQFPHQIDSFYLWMPFCFIITSKMIKNPNIRQQMWEA